MEVLAMLGVVGALLLTAWWVSTIPTKRPIVPPRYPPSMKFSVGEIYEEAGGKEFMITEINSKKELLRVENPAGTEIIMPKHALEFLIGNGLVKRK